MLKALTPELVTNYVGVGVNLLRNSGTIILQTYVNFLLTQKKLQT